MDNLLAPDEQTTDSSQAGRALIGIIVGVVLTTIGLIVIAVLLTVNAQSAAPGVRIIRDLLIIVMALEVVVIGAAVTIFLIQLARLVNLLHNEVEPLIDAASETVNTVRGTALFLSKNLVEPVTNVSSALRGLGKVAGDVDAIRKAAGIVVEVANATSPTGASTQPRKQKSGERSSANHSNSTAGPSTLGKKTVRKRKSTRTTKEE